MPEGGRQRPQQERVHAHLVEGVEVRLEDRPSLVRRELVLRHQALPLVEEAVPHLPVTVDVEQQLLNLVEAHIHANLPRMRTLVKPGARGQLFRDRATGAPVSVASHPGLVYDRRAMTPAEREHDRRAGPRTC